jgi:hypothetical protein
MLRHAVAAALTTVKLTSGSALKKTLQGIADAFDRVRGIR